MNRPMLCLTPCCYDSTTQPNIRTAIFVRPFSYSTKYPYGNFLTQASRVSISENNSISYLRPLGTTYKSKIRQDSIEISGVLK